MGSRSLLLSLTVALGLSLTASPALAQGKGKGKQEQEPRGERVEDRYHEDDDWRRAGDDRYERGRGNGSGKVPPGWCKGKGNPHNTPENCGYGSRGRYDEDGRDGRGRYGSYEQEHADFHYYLDRKYSELSRRRPLDPMWQIRIRADKKAEHDRWHERAGRRHR